MHHNQEDFNITDIVWVAVDTETTGINPWKYEILEIGAVTFTTKSIIDRFQIIIKPKKKQDPKSRAIHKISDDEINANGVGLEFAMNGFFEFINGYPLIFHNASFDLSFLTISAKKENLRFPENNYYDTLYLLRTYKPELEYYSLEYLKKYLKIEAESHRALSDAEVTANLFQWILSDNLDNINTKKKFKSFLKYHRNTKSFEVRLPENLDSIMTYFNKYIHTKSMIKVKENNFSNSTIRNILPMEIMIFNQKLLLKCSVYPNNLIVLIPLAEAVIYDPERGPITIANI